MKISKHFTRGEMRCRCGCGFDTMDAETLRIADEVRDFVGHAIRPSSAARCVAHNRAVGGSRRSQHILGRAIDLPVRTPTAAYLWLIDKYDGLYGFGCYEDFIHIDTRSGPPERWVG